MTVNNVPFDLASLREAADGAADALIPAFPWALSREGGDYWADAFVAAALNDGTLPEEVREKLRGYLAEIEAAGVLEGAPIVRLPIEGAE